MKGNKASRGLPTAKGIIGEKAGLTLNGNSVIMDTSKGQGTSPRTSLIRLLSGIPGLSLMAAQRC